MNLTIKLVVYVTRSKAKIFLAAIHILLVTIGSLYCTCPTAEKCETQSEHHHEHSDGHLPDMHQLPAIVIQVSGLEAVGTEPLVLPGDIAESLYKSNVLPLRFLSFFFTGLDPPLMDERIPSFKAVRAPPLHSRNCLVVG